METHGGANFYDFHARMLFSNLGTFNRPDPKAGDYPWLSTYLYCAANPIRNIDPTGIEIIGVTIFYAEKIVKFTDR